MYTQNIKLNMDTGEYDPVSVKQNDSGFITTALDLNSYATKSYVDTQVSTLNTQIGDISTILASVI